MPPNFGKKKIETKLFSKDLRFLPKSNGWPFETVKKVVFLAKIVNLKF